MAGGDGKIICLHQLRCGSTTSVIECSSLGTFLIGMNRQFQSSCWREREGGGGGGGGGGRGEEREREGWRETDRQTDRQTDGRTDGRIDRDR